MDVYERAIVKLIDRREKVSWMWMREQLCSSSIVERKFRGRVCEGLYVRALA